MPKSTKPTKSSKSNEQLDYSKIKINKSAITDTLTDNFMPYAMSVIVSRALPEIDGFKPSHRKLLYIMYTMGLLNGAKMKSANVVGRTMTLNPHGDAAIYETLVRLSKGNESLLVPFVDSKGNFGKVYSRDMQYAAARYTEVKLEAIGKELFADIDSDTVDFVDNYDATSKEPTLLPISFPNILINPNLGMAVGMASNICSFNLNEICDTTILLLKDEEADISHTLQAPDFSTGGYLIYNADVMREIFNTGRGSFKLRSKYSYDSQANCIDIKEIPYTATIEAIIDKIADLVKSGKIKEISDARNETDLNGLKVTLDLKKGTDPDKLMLRLFKMTPLEDSFSCNFNILIQGTPRVMGVREILTEWISFRMECIRRRVYFEVNEKKSRLHLLRGLEKILLDIDKAITIIRRTDEENEVIPNLMIGFGIDTIQAEYVADIRLRHLNKEYILSKTREIEDLLNKIKDLELILSDKDKIKDIISVELKDIKKKYAKPRLTELLHLDDVEAFVEEEHIENYPVTYFLTAESYFKKITPLSLRMGGEHKLKQSDKIVTEVESVNKAELVFFTDKAQAYKCRGYEYEDSKASLLGDYLPSKLKMDNNEKVCGFVSTEDFSGFMVFLFADGRAVKLELKGYETKQNRKKLVNAIYGGSRLVKVFHLHVDCDIIVTTSAGKYSLINTALIPLKSTKSSQGVIALTLRGQNALTSASLYKDGYFSDPKLYRTKSLPTAGTSLKENDMGQLTL